MLHITNLVKIGPVDSEEKMLTDDGRQPIAIGQLSDSDDLKKERNEKKWVSLHSKVRKIIEFATTTFNFT